jgi:hypothetical protein
MCTIKASLCAMRMMGKLKEFSLLFQMCICILETCRVLMRQETLNGNIYRTHFRDETELGMLLYSRILKTKLEE